MSIVMARTMTKPGSVVDRGDQASSSSDFSHRYRGTAPLTAPLGALGKYSPFELSDNAGHFGLTTSSMRVRSGTIIVRHGRRTDRGTATILLHGAAGSWTTWTPLLRAADETGYDLTDLIIPDLPGWGDSDLPTDTSRLSIESMAELIAEVAQSLGYESWNVIGHSMGGFIALQLAASETQATASVGLVSATSFSMQASVRRPVRNFSVMPAFSLLLLTMRVLGRAGRTGGAVVRAVTRLGLLRALVSPLFDSPGRVPSSVVDALGTELRPHGFVLAAVRAAAYDSATRWGQILCPVRSVRGENDVFLTVDDDRQLRAAVPHSVVNTLRGAGHFAHIERPVALLAGLGLTLKNPLALVDGVPGSGAHACN